MAGWHSLSGYLLQRPTGPLGRLQSRRRRWFVFDEHRCELLAYSNEAEHLSHKDPIDCIPIRGAGILLSDDQANQFIIQSRGNEYVLIADTHEAMMIWLLALQAKRDAYNNHLATIVHAGRRRRCSIKSLLDNRKTSLPSDQELESMIRRASHAEDDSDFLLRNRSLNLNSGPRSLPILENVSPWRPSSDSSDAFDVRSSVSEPTGCHGLPVTEDGNERRKLSDTTGSAPLRRQRELESELISVKCELAKSLNREASLKHNIQEAYQRICTLEDRLQGGNIAPCGGNCGQRLQEKARILQNQNRFLNEEVLKVSRQWQQDHLSFTHAQQRLADQEDLIEQLSRDYILLMQVSLSTTELDYQSNVPKLLGGVRHKNRILKLLEECRRLNPSLPSLDGIRKFSCHVDAYGFRNCPEGEACVLQYLCAQLSQHFETQLLDHEPQRGKWRQILGSGNSLTVTKELKNLVRAGIPADIRNNVWVQFVYVKIADIMTAKGAHYYNHLVSLVPDSQMVCQSRRQIALDLLRTMPDNIHFSDVNADGIQKMQEVLQAFCLHNPSIGYCQGMNFIVAVALLFMEPSDAFWLLVAISERYFLPHYFDQSLVGAQADQHVLRELVQEKLPTLSDHLENYDIELCTVTLNWFLALFFDCIPFQTLLRIWDCFLLEGPKVLFRFSLALLKINEAVILDKNDPVAIMRQIKSAAKFANDVDALIKVAFEELEPFVHRADIAVKQSCYHKILKENHKKRLVERKVVESKQKMLQDLNASDKITIECASVYDRDKIWMCQGNQALGQIFQVNGSDNVMYSLNIEFNSRVMCIHMVNDKIMLIGTLAHLLYAFNVFSRDQIWKIETNDAMLALCSHCVNGEFRAYAALADGTIAIFENICSSSNSLITTSYVKISSSPISCSLLVNEHLWCTAANKVILLNTKTLDIADQFVVSSNVMDVVSHIVEGEHGVWLAVRGSSVIQVWDRQSLMCRLMFDIGNQRYPHRTHDDDAFNPSRVTALLPFKNSLWVGTGDGNLLVYDISCRSPGVPTIVDSPVSESELGSAVSKMNLDSRETTNSQVSQKTVRDRSDSGYQTVGLEVHKDQNWDYTNTSNNLMPTTVQPTGYLSLTENIVPLPVNGNVQSQSNGQNNHTNNNNNNNNSLTPITDNENGGNDDNMDQMQIPKVKQCPCSRATQNYNRIRVRSGSESLPGYSPPNQYSFMAAGIQDKKVLAKSLNALPKKWRSVTSIHSEQYVNNLPTNDKKSWYQRGPSNFQKMCYPWRYKQYHHGSFDDVSHLLSASRESLFSSPFCDSFEYDDVFIPYTEDENCACSRLTDSLSDKFLRSYDELGNFTDRRSAFAKLRRRRGKSSEFEDIDVNEKDKLLDTKRNLCISIPIEVSVNGPETTPKARSKGQWSSLEDISTPSHIEYDSVQDSYNRMDYLKLGLEIPSSTAKSSESGSYVSYASSDAPYILELRMQEKIKIGKYPVKVLLSINCADREPVVVSCSGACGDEDAVLKWSMVENKLWTSYPILEVCPYTNEIKQTAYSSRHASHSSSTADDADPSSATAKHTTHSVKINSRNGLHQRVADMFTAE